MTTASEMRERIKNKKKAATGQMARAAADPDNEFRLKRWYEEVRADRSKVAEAAKYYNAAVEDAEKHIIAIGHLETLVAETPGLAHFYKTIRTDAQQIRRWLEERLEIETQQKYKWLMTSPEAKAEFGELKTTEAGKFAKADEGLASMFDDMRLMAYYEHLLDDVVSGFDNRGYMLNHLVTIYKEKLEAVWVDPTKETKNQ